jgi:hypothetical protein
MMGTAWSSPSGPTGNYLMGENLTSTIVPGYQRSLDPRRLARRTTTRFA